MKFISITCYAFIILKCSVKQHNKNTLTAENEWNFVGNKFPWSYTIETGHLKIRICLRTQKYFQSIALPNGEYAEFFFVCRCMSWLEIRCHFAKPQRTTTYWNVGCIHWLTVRFCSGSVNVSNSTVVDTVSIFYHCSHFHVFCVEDYGFGLVSAFFTKSHYRNFNQFSLIEINVTTTYYRIKHKIFGNFCQMRSWWIKSWYANQ